MRKEQELQEEFKKDANFEQILKLMNTTLHQAEDELIENVEERFPTIHIIGAPRSGTTLLIQLLAERLGVGYINNLIAAFWKAPLFGIALSNQLLNTDFRSSYSSKFGRTNRIQEPHEFGYFWNYHLNYDDFLQKDVTHENSIDWERLATVLKNMCRAIDKPVVFKSFLLGFHAARLVEQLPKSCFIYVRRNLIDNALSILKMRRNYVGDVDEWASIKPKQYSFLKDRDRYVQVMGQVLFLEYEYFKQLEQIPDKNKLIIDYTDLCSQPDTILNEVRELIDHHYEKETAYTPGGDNNLEVSQYDKESYEAEKLKQAKQYLLSEFTEFNDLVESRKKNIID